MLFIFDLPCRLGETFMSLKFIDWVDGKRIYEEDKTYVLNGFDKSLYGIECYGKNGKDTKYVCYDEEFGTKQYIKGIGCSFSLSKEYFEYHKLSEWGFPSDRTGKLMGFRLEHNITLAHFCIEPRYEHIYFAINDLEYGKDNVSIIYNEELETIIKAERSKAIEKVLPHGEEIVLTETDKASIVKMIIESGKTINLKIRKIDIDLDRIKASYNYKGKKTYSYALDKSLLGTRAKNISKKPNIDNILVLDEKILFSFHDIC